MVIDFSRKVASATWVYLRKHIVGRVTLPDLLAYDVGKMMFGGGGGGRSDPPGPPFLCGCKTMVFLGQTMVFLGQTMGFLGPNHGFSR